MAKKTANSPAEYSSETLTQFGFQEIDGMWYHPDKPEAMNIVEASKLFVKLNQAKDEAHFSDPTVEGGAEEPRPVLEYTERWEDENGNVTENQTAITVDNAPAVIVDLQELLIHEAVRLASCGDGECLEDNTQFGGRVFSSSEVILYCYRLEVAKPDAEIALYVAGLIKTGVLVKTEKRGQYQASAIMRMSIKGVRELAEKKLNSR